MSETSKNENINGIIKRYLWKNRRLDKEMLRGDYLKYKMSDLFKWKVRDHALPNPEKELDEERKKVVKNMKMKFLTVRKNMVNALTNLMQDVDYKGIAVASYLLFGPMIIYEGLWTKEELKGLDAKTFKDLLNNYMFAKKAGDDADIFLKDKTLIPYPM